MHNLVKQQRHSLATFGNLTNDTNDIKQYNNKNYIKHVNTKSKKNFHQLPSPDITGNVLRTLCLSCPPVLQGPSV